MFRRVAIRKFLLGIEVSWRANIGVLNGESELIFIEIIFESNDSLK